MSEDNFWSENPNLPIGWMTRLSTKKLDAQGNYTRYYRAPEGTIFRSRILLLKYLSTNGRQGEHEKLKTVVLHGKRTISHVSYLIFTFFGSAKSTGIDGKTLFFRAFPNQTRKIGENAIYIYIFLISLCFLLFLRNVYPVPRKI